MNKITCDCWFRFGCCCFVCALHGVCNFQVSIFCVCFNFLRSHYAYSIPAAVDSMIISSRKIIKRCNDDNHPPEIEIEREKWKKSNAQLSAKSRKCIQLPITNYEHKNQTSNTRDMNKTIALCYIFSAFLSIEQTFLLLSFLLVFVWILNGTIQHTAYTCVSRHR